jgi:hypothetical protein
VHLHNHDQTLIHPKIENIINIIHIFFVILHFHFEVDLVDNPDVYHSKIFHILLLVQDHVFVLELKKEQIIMEL